MRIFLDANVLFSAADAASATRQLLGMAAAAAQLVTSPHVLEEARRNLELKRPELLPGLDEIMRQVELSAGFREVSSSLPQQDVPVLAGAVGARCTHLWTGDKRHFGAYYGRTIHGVSVVSAIQLLDVIRR